MCHPHHQLVCLTGLQEVCDVEGEEWLEALWFLESKVYLVWCCQWPRV